MTRLCLALTGRASASKVSLMCPQLLPGGSRSDRFGEMLLCHGQVVVSRHLSVVDLGNPCGVRPMLLSVAGVAVNVAQMAQNVQPVSGISQQFPLWVDGWESVGEPFEGGTSLPLGVHSTGCVGVGR